MSENLVFGLYKRTSKSADSYVKTGTLPPLYVKRITDEVRSLKDYVAYFPHPFSYVLGSEGRSVSIQGHFGDQSYPFEGNDMYDIMAKVHAGKFLKVEVVSDNFPEMALNTLWLVDGISTERDAKIAGFLYVTLNLFGVQKKGGGWKW